MAIYWIDMDAAEEKQVKKELDFIESLDAKLTKTQKIAVRLALESAWNAGIVFGAGGKK